MEEELNSILGRDLSIFVDSPEKLIIDKRGPICCKHYCQNYGHRCYCPPHCLSPDEFSAFKEKFSTLIILARCVPPSEWTYVKKNPENEFNPKKHKVYFRRWVQITTWTMYKNIYRKFPSPQDSFFLFGTSLSRCYKCKTSLKVCKSKIAWPSPEAVGVDVHKTLKQFDYCVNFGVLKDIIRVGMILTNNFNDLIEYKQMNSPSTQQVNSLGVEEIIDDLEKLKHIDEIIKIDPIKLRSKSGINYSLWSKGILWKLKKNNIRESQYKKFKTYIHQQIFMNNNYYSISVDSRDIDNLSEFIPDKTDFYGIELIN